MIDTTRLGGAVSRLLEALSPVRAHLFQRSPLFKGLDWRARKGFWSLTWSATVALQRWPRRASLPRHEKPISLL